MRKIILAVLLSSLGLLFCCVPGAGAQEPTPTPWLWSVGAIDSYNAGRLVVSGNYGYLADGDGGLQILNLADATNPQIVGRYDTPHTAYNVALDTTTNLAYVADYNSVQVVNVAQKDAPILVDTITNVGLQYVYSTFVTGSYLYVGGYDYIYRYNLADLSQRITFLTSAKRFGTVTRCGVSNICVLSQTGASFYIFDMNLVQIARMDGIQATSGNVRNNDLVCIANYCFLGQQYTFSVVDIANPVLPVLVSSVVFPSVIYGLTVSGSYAYIANGSGFDIYDVSDPVSPGALTRISTSASAYDVIQSGSYYYVPISTSGLQIFSGSPPPTGGIGSDDETLYINTIPALTPDQTPLDILPKYSISIKDTAAGSGLAVIAVFFLFLSFRFIYWVTHR